MAVDYFLKIDGIKGESRDAKHAGDIEIESFSFGVSNGGSVEPGGRTGGGRAGRASFDDFTFVMRASTASPQIFQACASGQHLGSAILTARRSGGDQQDFLKYTLTDVLVSRYQQAAASESSLPLDQMSLNFAKVQVEYRPQSEKGSLEAPVTAGWDLKLNKF
jgi:type VI secretion system secreted protein Hcp